MRCSKFRKAVLPLAMETGDERELALRLERTDVKLRSHLDSCDECRSYLRSCRETLAGLSVLEADQPGERKWSEVRDAIHEAVRQKAPVYGVVWPSLSRVSWARVGAVAAVALIISALSFVYFRPVPLEESLPRTLRVAGAPGGEEVELAFLDELEVTDREYDELISEIDELMREIDTAYAQLDIGTGEVSLDEGRFENIIT